MRQTLIRIPLDGPWSFGPLGEAPGFGFGVVLLLWCVFGAVWLYRHRRELTATANAISPIAVWVVVAVGIVLVPRIVQRPADNAVAEADQVLATNPRSVEALFQRSRARYAKREYAAAIDDLQAAAAIDPGRAETFDRLAWMQATCPDAAVRNGTAAVENATKACTLTNSEHPTFLATLAAARSEHGDDAGAVETLRKALPLAWESDDPRVFSEATRMRAQLQSHERKQPYRDHSAGKYLPIFGFGAMLFSGFVAAAWTAGRRGARVGIAPETIWDMGIWVFIAGVIGCRVFYCIQYASTLFYTVDDGVRVLKSLPELLFSAINLPDGGLVYFGGLPTGILAAAWFCRRRKISFLEFGDVAVPSVFLAMAIGRVGCFLNGCCYGDRCDLPWGVLFPMGSVPDIALVQRGFVGPGEDLSIRLHPTQLYSSLDGVFLALLTHAYFPFRARNGAVIALGALTYPLTRFAIELLRGDELGKFSTSLTISQWISVLVFAGAVGYAVWLARRPSRAAT